jgi:hypothetical protein
MAVALASRLTTPGSGAPSIEPVLMIRMLIVGYVFAIAHDRCRFLLRYRHRADATWVRRGFRLRARHCGELPSGVTEKSITDAPIDSSAQKHADSDV